MLHWSGSSASACGAGPPPGTSEASSTVNSPLASASWVLGNAFHLKSSAASSTSGDARSTSANIALGDSTTSTPICCERSRVIVPPAPVTSASTASRVPAGVKPSVVAVPLSTTT
jgi:hypothetical protein